MSPRLRSAVIIVACWTALGLFLLTGDLARAALWNDPTPTWKYLASWVVGVYVVAALTPLAMWAGRRFPIERANWVRRVAIHTGLAVVWSAVALLAIALLQVRLGFFAGIPMPDLRTALPVIALFVSHNHIMGYGAIIGVAHAIAYYRRYVERARAAAELQAALVGAQLGALRAQLQPHFLFNTLNAIMVLVRAQRSAEAEDTLAKLGDLLRAVLDHDDAPEIALRRELELVNLYLDIERVRFADRLRVEIDAAPDTLDAALPQLALQPLVENAIRHGIGRRQTAGALRITARRRGDQLRVEIADDGPGPSAPGEPGAETGRGIGLANTRARLARMYGAGASLELAPGAAGGAVATLAVPWHAPSAELVCAS